jgi:hypothetical protein
LIGIDEFEKQANTHALRQAITHILLLQRLKLLLQCLLHDRSNKCQTPINQNWITTTTTTTTTRTTTITQATQQGKQVRTSSSMSKQEREQWL